MMPLNFRPCCKDQDYLMRQEIFLKLIMFTRSLLIAKYQCIHFRVVIVYADVIMCFSVLHCTWICISSCFI